MKKLLILGLILFASPALAGQSTNTITADGTVKVGNCYKRNELCEATIYANGTFGSGTIAWEWSVDGGTTKQPIKDMTQVAMTSTEDDSFGVKFGQANNTAKDLGIYATMSGSTTPSVTVGILTND